MKRKAPTTKRKTNSVQKKVSSPTSRGEGQGEGVAQRDFYQSVAEILRAARVNAYRAVNFAMVEAYWNVGRKSSRRSSAAKSVRAMGRN